jgi:hypothetical protein
MGVKTRLKLITEALQLAGDTSLDARAVEWIDDALRAVYDSAEWPFLRKRFTHTPTAGTKTFTFGNGSITTDRVFKILTASYTYLTSASGQVELYDGMDLQAADDPSINTAITPGAPDYAYLSNPENPYAWVWQFARPTQHPYTFLIWAQITPVLANSDSAVPIYPNDRTIMKSLYVEALRHQDDARLSAEERLLQQMIEADRVKYLSAGTQRPNIGLASHRFAQRSKRRSPFGE